MIVTLLNGSYCCSSNLINRHSKKHCFPSLYPQDRGAPLLWDGAFSRRHAFIFLVASFVPTLDSWSLTPPFAKAEVKSFEVKEDEKDAGFLGAIQSLFDPNEMTKSGKVLPKSYLKSVKEVVKTLRDSLMEDEKDVSKFRRTADAAKESIREYLNGWRGNPTVTTEESYVALEKAIRALAGFYSKAGPFAAMPDDVKSIILDYLNTAEAFS